MDSVQKAASNLIGHEGKGLSKETNVYNSQSHRNFNLHYIVSIHDVAHPPPFVINCESSWSLTPPVLAVRAG
jgi:hypothetical protein